MESRTNARLDAMELRLKGHVEKVETNLLGAFHGWARGMELRRAS